MTELPASGTRATVSPRRSSGSRRAARRSRRSEAPGAASSATRSSVGVSVVAVAPAPAQSPRLGVDLRQPQGIAQRREIRHGPRRTPAAASRRRPSRLRITPVTSNVRARSKGHSSRSCSASARSAAASASSSEPFAAAISAVDLAAVASPHGRSRRRPYSSSSSVSSKASSSSPSSTSVSIVIGWTGCAAHSPRPISRSIGGSGTSAALRCFVIAGHELQMAECREMVRQPDRRADLSRVLDARVQDAAGVVDAPEVRRDETARVPLLTQLPAELPVEVDELGGVCLRLREMTGPHFQLDEMKNAPGGRLHPSELDGLPEELEQDRASVGELACIEEREAVAGAWRSGRAQRRGRVSTPVRSPVRTVARRDRFRSTASQCRAHRTERETSRSARRPRRRRRQARRVAARPGSRHRYPACGPARRAPLRRSPERPPTRRAPASGTRPRRLSTACPTARRASRA